MKRILFLLLLTIIVSCSSSDDQNITSTNCPIPNGVQIDNITGNSITISWSAINEAQSYWIEYGVNGFVQNSGTIVNSTSTSQTISNLDGATAYQFYIRSNCGANNLSNWFGPVSFTTSCNAGAFNGDVTLTTQQEVNNFANQCYTSINGNLTINEDPTANNSITSLQNLSDLIAVNGNLLIFDNPSLSSLNGLGNINVINHLYLKGNTILTNITPLNNVQSITNGGLVILDNPQLVNLNGLDNITTIDSWLNIRNNNSLNSLSGLNALLTVNDDVVIENNMALTNFCALTGLFSTGTITGNTSIHTNAYNPTAMDIQNGTCSQ